jgi:NAD(P)-dependent dehydrogenase (short-subunit alcohol dehydrogenase family)
MSRYALVTGSAGAIGSAICQVLRDAGYLVCGVDCVAKIDASTDHFIKVDLNHLVNDEDERSRVISEITTWLENHTLDVLVNNAAYQYVSQKHPMPVEELKKSYSINVIAPYVITTSLANVMTPALASVVNIGSVHSRLTKPGFVAYATTKAALASLTRGLALDYEDRFRINCIEPASVETPMLLDGFKACPDKKATLEHYHPQKRISTPNEIAEMVLAISSPAVRFLHGACIDMSGGIASRLHDPV